MEGRNKYILHFFFLYHGFVTLSFLGKILN